MLLDRTGLLRAGGPRPPARRIARLVALTLLAVALGGWALAANTATGPDTEAARDGSGGHGAPPDLAALHRSLPLHALRYTWTGIDAKIEAATDRLVTVCMARHGQRYDPGPAKPIGDADSATQPFGLETLDDGSRPDPSISEVTGGKGEAYGRALYGDPERRISAGGKGFSVSRPADGCLAEAETDLLGDGRQRWIELHVALYEIERRTEQQILTDPRLGEVTASWRKCMKRAKVIAPDPLALYRDMSRQPDFRHSEIAKADVACKYETGYLQRGYERLAALQREALASDPTLLRDRSALQRRQSQAANRVLAG